MPFGRWAVTAFATLFCTKTELGQNPGSELFDQQAGILITLTYMYFNVACLYDFCVKEKSEERDGCMCACESEHTNGLTCMCIHSSCAYASIIMLVWEPDTWVGWLHMHNGWKTDTFALFVGIAQSVFVHLCGKSADNTVVPVWVCQHGWAVFHWERMSVITFSLSWFWHLEENFTSAKSWSRISIVGNSSTAYFASVLCCTTKHCKAFWVEMLVQRVCHCLL